MAMSVAVLGGNQPPAQPAAEAQSPATATITPTAAPASCGTGPLNGRTQIVVDAVVAATAGVTDCADITASHLSALTSLTLSNKNLASLQAGDFAGMTNLRRLDLRVNQLTSLPSGLFSGLSNLETIDLRLNRLQSLPSGIFDGLSSLITLNLRTNRLQSLPSGIFNDLTALQNLMLFENRITSLDKDVFSTLTNLRFLWIYSNQISSLDKDIFDGLTSLTQLRLGSNRISSLHAETFADLSSLQRLYLNDNPIRSLPTSIFSTLTNLQYLILYRSDLTSISADTLRGLANLRWLHTWGTRIGNLPPEFFDGLGLTSLNDILFGPISANDPDGTMGRDATEAEFQSYKAHLPALPSRFYIRMAITPDEATTGPTPTPTAVPAMTEPTASCGSSPLNGRTQKVVDKIVAKIPGISDCADVTATHLANVTGTLSLTYYSAPYLHSLQANDLNGLTSLQRISIFSDGLTSIPAGIFDQLDSLQTISITSYGLTSLPAGIFDQIADTLAGSTSSWGNPGISVNAHRMTSIPSGLFNGMTNLKSIRLCTNISQLANDAFDSMTDLRVMTLTCSNSMTSLPAGIFDNLTMLTTLNLYENNNLASLPNNVFDNLTMLRTLNIEKNNLASLPNNVFDNLAMLTVLYLNNNNLASLPNNVFDNLAMLTVLYLNNNNLASLPNNVFDSLAMLTTLELQDNRLTSLQADIFSQLTNLRTLLIHRNMIATLPQNLFNGLESLTQLHLYSTHLQQVLPSYFAGQDLDTLAQLYFGDVSGPHPSLQEFQEWQAVLPALARLRLPPPNAPQACGTQSPLDGKSHVLVQEVVKQIDGVSRCQDITTQHMQSVTTLDLSNKRLRSIQLADFRGFSSLQTLNLQNNPLEHLPLSQFRGLDQLHTLRLGESSTAMQASPQHLASYRSVMPMLMTLLLSADAPVPTPEPTQVPDSPDEPAPILRIEPGIESVSIRAGSKVRLSVDVFGLQNQQDDSLGDEHAVTFEWISDGGGTFSESAPVGRASNGEADDRKVLHTVPDTPGTYTVTARLDRPSECSGTEEQCRASIRIIATRSLEIAPSPTPVPCEILGTVPSAISDSQGVQYSVFTPADGGIFTGDDGGEITASIGAIDGCEYIGIRIDNSGSAVNANSVLYRYTLAGDLYSVSAVDASGDPVSDYRFNRAVRICVPLPPALRGNISDIAALNINSDGSLTALTSKIISTPNGSPKVCGALSRLPAEIAAGKRGAPDPTFAPMPTATPDPPETGGRALPQSWVFLIAVLGVGVVMLGSATLGRRNTKSSPLP